MEQPTIYVGTIVFTQEDMRKVNLALKLVEGVYLASSEIEKREEKIEMKYMTKGWKQTLDLIRTLKERLEDQMSEIEKQKNDPPPFMKIKLTD